MRLGTCEARGCPDRAIGFDDDGRALCEDHLFEWLCEQSDGAEEDFLEDGGEPTAPGRQD